MCVVCFTVCFCLCSYADEFRELAVEQDFEAATPTAEQVLQATKLSECLVSDFDPDMFPNPGLQLHFATLKSFALNKNETKFEVREKERKKDAFFSWLLLCAGYSSS